jgi:hypothetical protein
MKLGVNLKNLKIKNEFKNFNLRVIPEGIKELYLKTKQFTNAEAYNSLLRSLRNEVW